MANTLKYNKELDKIAYDAIALAGTDRAAIEALGVTKTTFYSWCKRHASFEESVTSAREFYRSASPEVQEIRLLAYMAQVLQDGHHRVSCRTRTVTRTVRRNSMQQVIYTDELETVTEREEYKPIQSWIADKLKPNASDLSAAILKVVGAGLRVSDPTLPLSGKSSHALSAQDMEAIATIKENLLFGSQD